MVCSFFFLKKSKWNKVIVLHTSTDECERTHYEYLIELTQDRIYLEANALFYFSLHLLLFDSLICNVRVMFVSVSVFILIY